MENKENFSLKEEVGKRMKERRIQMHLTQREVAQKLGVAQPVYQRFEKGVFECNYALLVSICRLYDISAVFLLGLNEY